MVSIASPLKGKQVGVIGFNARPIAWSAKQAGASVIVSDYWGDDDLSSCCDSWIAVLTPTPGARQRQPLDMPLPVALVDNLLYLAKERKLDMVLIGSGFDDYSEAIKPLEDMGLLVGCSSTQIDKARDFPSLEKLAKKLEIYLPKRTVFDTPDEVLEDAVEINFPCVVRPTHSGGGSGIRLARSLEDVTAAFPDRDEESEPRVVQEYVSGIDVSCSVLSTGDLAQSLSVQGQLIGMPTAGKNCGFAYCGNYHPVNLRSEVEANIIEVSEYVSTKLGLLGSVGIDFVVDKNEQVWLMEVNPRIQGSLELIESAGDISVTEMHVRATRGVLPSERPQLQAGVKMVVYSRQDGTVPDLAKYSNTVDRSPLGVMVNMGDPICTVIEIGSSMKDCYRGASETALAIQNDIS
ncbi:MAG: ATP-grasp domain-containing protein [Candidatus Thorarchaeota archaeon]|jgi:predicted ATP-grasp superfamily ATP-dependent carboligase